MFRIVALYNHNQGGKPMAEFLIVFGIMFILGLIFVGFLLIPIWIANARGICGGEKTTISILSWMGIFFGITWIVALILSLVWRGECAMRETNLDKLEKVSKLYRNKSITREEYNEIKSKLLD